MALSVSSYTFHEAEARIRGIVVLSIPETSSAARVADLLRSGERLTQH